MYFTPNTSVDISYHSTCVGLVDLINGTVAETGRCDSGYDYAQPRESTLITEVSNSFGAGKLPFELRCCVRYVEKQVSALWPRTFTFGHALTVSSF